MRNLIAAISLVLGACGSAGSTGTDDESGDGSSDTSSTTAAPTTSATTTTSVTGADSGEASTGAAEGSSSEGSEEASSTTDDGPPPADCEVAMPLAPGDYERMLDFGGVMRRYDLHVSPSRASSAPLVVNMHGYLSNPTMQAGWSQLNDAADPRGIITAHPEGLDNSWNAGTCCGTSSTNDVDDVGFIRAVVADIESVACVDPQRIYATGLSNGGFMSNRLGCEASDLFAAVAPVVGALRIPLEECTPARPMPIFAFNGVQDPLVPYADAVATIDRWVEVDGCDPEPMVEELDGGDCQTYSGCEGDGDVRFCTLDPMGHCWPGGDPAFCYAFIGPHSDAVDATERMLDFFAAHTLP
jgi:polyhydroxybutyrate depolymerase